MELAVAEKPRAVGKPNHLRDAMVEGLAVKVRNVTFSNPQSGYAVVSVYPDTAKHPSRESFTCVGRIASISLGETVLVWGEWVEHKKFGMQLQVERFEYPQMPTDGDSVQGFLETGFVKGVGPALAKRIVEHFGDQTVFVIENQPERLMEVSGIGRKTYKRMAESWNLHRFKRESIVEFQAWGLGPGTIQKVLNRWPNGNEAVQAIRENPYVLAWEIVGVGFTSADAIAKGMGYAADNPNRIKACVLYSLDQAASGDGHCFMERAVLVSETASTLDPQVEDTTGWHPLVEQAIEELFLNNRLVLHGEGRDMVYKPNLWTAEEKVVGYITRLLRARLDAPQDLGPMVAEYETVHCITMHEKQREAVCSALSNSVSIITGGPGTGKTTIVRAVTTIAGRLGVEQKRIALASPTGRAAKRLEESTGMPASTIHRLLGFKPGEGFTNREDNPLKHKLVIVDEVSMLDISLARALLAAVGEGARVVFVGDKDQLPSVGPGNVLKDLIVSRLVPVVELTHIYRQDEGSFISLNAAAVRMGDRKGLCLDNTASNDFKWWNLDDGKQGMLQPSERARMLADRVIFSVEVLIGNYGFAPRDIQVLAPMYKSVVGVAELNRRLQQKLNPGEKGVTIGFTEFRIGDRVMQMRNDYDLDVFNGDQGYILGIDPKEEVVIVDMNGRQVIYDYAQMDQVVLSYACTIHKSQGSEYPAVVIPLSTSNWIMLQRNLLYTAVTRAKGMCVLVGETMALTQAVRSVKTNKRNTLLSGKLRAAAA